MVEESLALTNLLTQMQGRTAVRPEVFLKGERVLGDFDVGKGHNGKVCALKGDAFQGGERFGRHEKGNATGLVGHALDECAPSQGEHHGMHARERDLEIPLHVRLSWRTAIHQSVLIEVGQELALPIGWYRWLFYILHNSSFLHTRTRH